MIRTNMELYKSCWYPKMAEKEGMYSRILMTKTLERTTARFKEPQKVDSEDFVDQGVHTTRLTSPLPKRSGVGSLTMKEN